MSGFPSTVRLGRSNLEVSPLGVSGGYGVPASALLRAWDRGVNYFYHGSRRRDGMSTAIREIVAAGERDRLVVVLQSYSRIPSLLESFLRRGLRDLGIDHADVLLLGWFNRPPGPRIMDRVEALREGGLFRHLAVSAHRRPVFGSYAADRLFDILHVRYNAAHTGAESDVFPLLGEGRPGTVVYTATRWGSLLKASKMPPGEAPLRGRDAYRFVLTHPSVDVCMTGPASAAEMDEALAALVEGPMDEEEEERARRIGSFVHGRSARRG